MHPQIAEMLTGLKMLEHIKYQNFTKVDILSTQTNTILNSGPLSVGGYSQASQAHKALSSTFYCGGEFI